MNDTEMNVRFYLPHLIKLGGEDVLDWDACQKTFLDVRALHEAGGKEGKQVEANIYELILAIKIGHPQAYRFVNFCDQLLGSLNLILDEKGKKKIRPILTNIFTAHDHKFLNFLGELIVLSKLLHSKIFLLNNVEVVIPNNKRIDFELVNLNQGGRLDLLEVHNVHLDDDKVQEDDKKLLQFFSKRRRDKIEETKAGLTADMEINFMQVYWGGFESLCIYAFFFKRHYAYLKDLEPLAFATTYNNQDPSQFTHSYGRLHEVLAAHIE
ncbi:MAG: hypothetical protein JST90_17215 [Bacteroidetes bacterium]|nr:hypothetical protein [Bacteroidota bacterium]